MVADGLHGPDGPVNGAGLAGRVHLSRFHFDRVIGAVAGESPFAFRRRVLLERAAYRLLAEPVAAYSRSRSRPGTGRTRRSRGRSPGPMGCRHGSGDGKRRGCSSSRRPVECISSRRPGSAPAGTSKGERHGRTCQDGRAPRVADRRDDRTRRPVGRRHLDRPIELSVEGIDDDISIRYLLDRLVWQEEMWLASVEDRPFQVPECGRQVVTPIPELRTRHADAGARFVALVNQLNEEGRFDESFVDTTCEPPARLHLRRNGRPRPDLRRPPPIPPDRRLPHSRHHRPLLRRPHALRSRRQLTAAVVVGKTRLCGVWRDPMRSTVARDEEVGALDSPPRLLAPLTGRPRRWVAPVVLDREPDLRVARGPVPPASRPRCRDHVADLRFGKAAEDDQQAEQGFHRGVHAAAHERRGLTGQSDASYADRGGHRLDQVVRLGVWYAVPESLLPRRAWSRSQYGARSRNVRSAESAVVRLATPGRGAVLRARADR